MNNEKYNKMNILNIIQNKFNMSKKILWNYSPNLISKKQSIRYRYGCGAYFIINRIICTK